MVEAASIPYRRDRSQYQGKKLGFLLLAMGLPSGLLYLRILLGTVSGYSRTLTPFQIGRLTIMSNCALAAFFVVQVFCAAYIQRLVPPRQTRFGRCLQYFAVLALCVVLSVTGAILFEAFGVIFLMRTRGL